VTPSHDPPASDPYRLERFVKAQQHSFKQACAELRRGQKTSHWMWFIFPQIAGLGYSETARTYAISSLDEARAYLDHPTLGPRLREAARLVTLIKDRSVEQVFGYPDDLKLRSSMTLFAHATANNEVFVEVIRNHFGNEFDRRTLELIRL
jgi:uncharacterized protein (DUF1810 family)